MMILMTTSHCLMGRYCLHLQPQGKFTSTLALNVSCCYYCYYYYYYYLLCHSLCWFSFCASSYTEHLPEDSCRSQHADLWISVTVALSDNFFDVFYHPPLYCTKRTNNQRDHHGFHMPLVCSSSSRSLYLPFFSISFNAMFLSDGTVISISLQVEFTESLTMVSGLFLL